MSDIWTELGIAETADTRAIRRAYAGRLRQVSPDRDPAAFQRLRDAYERALHVASREAAQAPPEQPADKPVDEGAPAQAPQPEPEPEPPSPEQIELREMADDINRSLHAKNYDKALTVYDQGVARGTFAFGYREYVLEVIMQGAVRDLSLSPGQFETLMGRAGWLEIPGAVDRVSQARQMAMARQKADAWFTRLRAAADGNGVLMHGQPSEHPVRQFLRARSDRQNAKLFFGGFALPKTRLFDVQNLQMKFDEYRQHAAWLTGKIEEKEGVRAEKLLKDYDRYGRWTDPALTAVLFLLYLSRTGDLEFVLPFSLVVGGLRGVLVHRRWRKVRG